MWLCMWSHCWLRLGNTAFPVQMQMSAASSTHESFRVGVHLSDNWCRVLAHLHLSLQGGQPDVALYVE